MAEPPLLALEDLSVGYRTGRGLLRALDRVSLDVPRGAAVGLVGKSGSGKSTVLLAVLGLLGGSAQVSARRATFGDEDVLSAAPRLRGRRIGMVFQDPSAALNPALPVGLQVAEPMLVHLRLPRAEAMERAAALLAEMGIPRATEAVHLYPHQLSGGMKQRVMIATALAGEPDLLLLDEPTTALDVTVEAQILDLLEGLRVRRGLSLLLVSHNLGIIDRLCSHVTVVYAGRTVETGPTAEVLCAPRHPYTRGLLAALPRPDRAHAGRLVAIPGGLPDLVAADPGCNFRPRCGFAVADCANPQILAREGLRTVRCHRAALVATTAEAAAIGAPERPVISPDTPPLLAATDLARAFHTGGSFAALPWVARTLHLRAHTAVRAVDGVSLAIRPGEVLGLVGESGCGKSTLGRLLLRLLPADAGRLNFAGTDVPAAPGTEFHRRAQIVFQNPDTSLNPRQTVDAILRRPLQRFSIARGPAVAREVEHLMALVRLPATYRERYPHQLSGGEKQRVGIARAIASRPDFLVCDEAVSALDVSVQAAVLNLLQDLRADLGIATLFISHDIGVIAHVADRIAVMYRGGIVEEGPASTVLQPPFHPYTEALLSAVPLVGERGRSAARVRLEGDPGALPAGPGCRFAARCPRHLGPVCDTIPPPFRDASEAHRIACHIPLDALPGAAVLLRKDAERGRTVGL